RARGPPRPLRLLPVLLPARWAGCHKLPKTPTALWSVAALSPDYLLGQLLRLPHDSGFFCFAISVSSTSAMTRLQRSIVPQMVIRRRVAVGELPVAWDQSAGHILQAASE